MHKLLLSGHQNPHPYPHPLPVHFYYVLCFNLYFKILLTDSRSNKYSSKIEDTRHIHTTYILLQIKYNNIYCTKKEVHSHTQL